MTSHNNLRERLSHPNLSTLIEEAAKLDLFVREIERREFGAQSYFIKQRAVDALDEVGNHKLAKRIRNCRAGNSCQCLYCPSCRNKVANAQLAKYTRHFELIDNPTNDNFNHISGVLGLASFNEKEARALIEADKRNFDAARRQIIKIDLYRFVEVAYEIELVDFRKLMRSNASDKKKKQVELLMGSSNRLMSERLFLYVHFHGITNLSKEEIHQVFRQRYYADGQPIHNHDSVTGLYIQPFRSTQPLDENLKKLASYPFKNATRFKHSFEGKDTGEEPLTPSELGQLISIYHSVQKDRYKGLFRSLSNGSGR